MEARHGAEARVGPKLLALPKLINQYGDEIEADLRETYQVDLLDMYRGLIRPVVVLRLVMQLGPGSRLAKKSAGPAGAWSTESHLLAHIVDVLAVANYQRGGGKGTRPKPISRPGSEPKTTRTGKATLPQADIKEYLDRLHSGQTKEG